MSLFEKENNFIHFEFPKELDQKTTPGCVYHVHKRKVYYIQLHECWKMAHAVQPRRSLSFLQLFSSINIQCNVSMQKKTTTVKIPVNEHVSLSSVLLCIAQDSSHWKNKGLGCT